MKFLNNLLSKGKKEQRLKVLMLSDNPGWIVDRAVDKLIEHIPCDFTKDYFPTIDTQKLLKISSDFDLIYYSNSALGFHMDTVVKIKTPIIVGIRSHRYKIYVTDLQEVIKKNHFYTQVINKELLKDFPDARYIPNGIFEQFKPSRKFVVGFAGQPTEYKGYQLIKQACRELNVIFKPATGNLNPSQMPSYYKSIDLLVSASINEGFCNPVHECMAMNIPVITTNTGAVKHYNLVKIERSVEGIKEGILKFYTWPQVRDITWKNVSEKMFDYFYHIAIAETKKKRKSLASGYSISQMQKQKKQLQKKYFN